MCRNENLKFVAAVLAVGLATGCGAGTARTEEPRPEAIHGAALAETR